MAEKYDEIQFYVKGFNDVLKSDIDDITILAHRMHALAARLPSDAAIILKDQVRRLWTETWEYPERCGVSILQPDELRRKPYKELKIDLLSRLHFPVAKNQIRFSLDRLDDLKIKLLELLNIGAVIVKIIYPHTSTNALNYRIENRAEAYIFFQTLLDQNTKSEGQQIWICSANKHMSIHRVMGRYVEKIDGKGYFDLTWGTGREIEKFGSKEREAIPALSANTSVGLLHLKIVYQNGGLLFYGQNGASFQRFLATRIWQQLNSFRSKLLDLEKSLRMSGISIEFHAEGNSEYQELKFSDFDTAMDG